MRYCGCCGCQRDDSVGYCQECRSPEFSTEPTILTEGWERRAEEASRIAGETPLTLLT